jgi:membrane protease YdiL (CAAX protease family)
MENVEKSKKFRAVCIIYFVIMLAFVAVRICSGYGLFDKIGDDTISDVVSTLIIQVGILFVLPLVLYVTMLKKKPAETFKDFGYKKINGKAILICFGIGILTYVINLFIATFFSMLISYAGYSTSYSTSTSSGYDTLPKFLLGVLTVAILPAFCEEFVHRGLLLRGTANTVGYKKAIIISSLLFGLLHLNIQQFFYAAILGLLMGFVATITRSIFPAMIIHFCNNFINVYLSFAESNNLFGANFTSFLNSIASKSLFLFFFVAIVLVALCILGILWLIKKLFMQTGVNNYNKMFDDIESGIRSTSETQMADSEVLNAFENIVFPNMKSPKSAVDFYIADNKTYGKVSFKYQIPLIACIFLGIVITVFTFIWGCV